MHILTPIDRQDGIGQIVNLAVKIWNQHFVGIIGQRQVDYMLQKFQSFDAISEQIGEGYEYYLLTQFEEPVGYLSIRPEGTNGRMVISKIYVDGSHRGEGHGRFLLDFTVEQSRRRELDAIWLTVNRHNTDTIIWYRRRGFKIVEEADLDIGQGFYMHDYIMEKSVH